MSNDEHTNKPLSQNENDAMTVMALFHALSIACQGVIDVKKPTGPVRPVSLNTLIVAESGQRKTSINSVLLKAIAKDGA